MGFFNKNSRFLNTGTVGNWPDRLNARYEAIIAANKPVFDGARVLDLASHDGRWTFAALDAGAAHVVGIEIRHELVATAIENMAALGVSRDRYRFEAVDVFECKEIFGERFDVVLCLGLFYHTARHVELLQLIRSTDARTLVLDTALLPEDRALSIILTESVDRPSNGKDKIGVRDNMLLVAVPTSSAVQLMLRHFGYTVQPVDWQALIGRLGLTPNHDQKQSAQNPVVDYYRRERGTFVATLK
jgi:hypothetical protein